MANCCEDIHGAFGLGNVFQQSLAQLWYSERHQQIVKDLVAGKREKYSLCRNCPASPSGPALPGRSIDLAIRRYDPPPGRAISVPNGYEESESNTQARKR
jgi:hypothetical protein